MITEMVKETTALNASTARPRVLVSGHLPPPVGGIATYFLALVNSELPELVDFAFVQTSTQKRALADSGRFNLRNLLWAAQDCARFAAAVLKHRPQVVHISTAFGVSFLKHSLCVWIARLAGCRVLLHPRCSISVLYLNRSKLGRWYFRQVVRQTSGVLALSREWMQLKSIVPSCTVYYLPNAIDQTPYRPIASERLARPAGQPPLRLLYLGYLGRDKGSFDLVEAARLLQAAGQSFHLDLVGDELHPGEKAELSRRIEAAGLEDCVQVHPPAYNQEKLAFFRNADLFIYPSHHEGLPNAVIEAMACALPVIATRVGGIPDQVQEGVNGFLSERGDAPALAASVQKLLADPALRRKMQIASARLAREQYDMTLYVPRLAALYRQVNADGQPSIAH